MQILLIDETEDGGILMQFAQHSLQHRLALGLVESRIDLVNQRNLLSIAIIGRLLAR